MYIKQLFSYLAVGLFMVACTSENELVNPVQPGPDNEGEAGSREVLLTVKNKLSLVSGQTKADIATAAENYINALDVYVFGSPTEDGTYTFQELFYYREDPAETVNQNWARTFTMNTAADGKTSTGLLRLKKGLFIKIYCVANQKELFATAADGTVTQFTDFVPLSQSAPGQTGNTVIAGKPNETEFKQLHGKVLNPATATDIIVTPLPMTGAYTTPLDLTDFSVSSRTQVGFKLSRMVARFDIVNNSEESKFTVTTVSMAKGRKGAYLFPVKPLGTEPAGNDDLITYPVRDLDGATQVQGNATTTGAFYTWPSPKDDAGYLILNGKYQVNKTETKNVTYKIPFEQVTNGTGSYIEVAGNHRYTIAITKADEYHLDFNLNVSDWSDEGHVDEYLPDNTFDAANISLVAGAQTSGAHVLSDGSVTVDPINTSKFAFTIKSNAVVTDVLTCEGDAWIERVGTKASMETTFSYKVADDVSSMSNIRPCVIRLSNTASGKIKEVRIIPTVGPAVAMAANYAGFSIFDAAANKLTLYNLSGETAMLTVTADQFDGENGATGSSVNTAGCTWLSADNVTSDKAVDTYTLTMAAAQGSASATGKLVFTSTATGKTTEIQVALKNPGMTLSAFDNLGNAGNSYSPTGGTGSIPQVTLAGTASNKFSIQVDAPEGMVPSVTTGDDWLSLSTRLTADGKTILTGQIKSDATGLDSAKTGKITLTNVITGGGDIEIEVVTTVVSAP